MSDRKSHNVELRVVGGVGGEVQRHGDELSKLALMMLRTATTATTATVSIFSLEAKHPITEGDDDECPPLRLPSFFLYIQVNYTLSLIFY